MSAAALVSVRLRDVGGQHRRVVGAEDVDGDRGQRAVGAGDREGVGVGGAGHELVVGGACGVGPGAGAIDGEGAVAAGGAGLRHEGRRAVDVADGRACRRSRCRPPRWSRSGCAVSADSTAASLVPRMLTVTDWSGAVGAGDREGVGVGGAGDELVVGRARGVGPGAGGIDGEGAVAAGGAGLRHEGRRAVDVADGQRAGGRDVGRRVGLGQVRRRRPRAPRRRWCRGC